MEALTLHRPTDLLDENFLHDIKARLLACGASDASVSIRMNRSFGTGVRNGEFENADHEEDCVLGLRAFVGQRSAGISTNDPSPSVIETLVDRVVRMATLASEDKFGGLPESSLLAPAGSNETLELADPTEPNMVEMEDSARELESYALAVEGVTESRGAMVGWTRSESRLVGSNGLSQHSRRTFHNAQVGVIAGAGDGRETSGFEHRAHWRADMLALAEIGARAGQYAVEKLGSRKVESGRAPVIFDRRVAFSLFSSFLDAISGTGIYHKQTYLPDALGTQLFPEGLTLLEDPFEKRGHASRITDSEGMAPFKGAIVENGVVRTLLISFYDGRRLQLPPTGHSGGTSNLMVMPGMLDRAALMREAGRGLIVTGIMGSSGNPATGDFSMGVSGLWFENGEIVYPVSESTIAGNFKELFGEIVVGSDIERLRANNSPSILVPPLAMGGK
tara:strand:- start:123955 stop:125298 length:1344 start_codon:yes stop_codon:yes gene_type:complete